MLLGPNDEARFFSDQPALRDTPYKITKVTIYSTNDAIVGIKANYYSFKTMSIITGRAHKIAKFAMKKHKLHLVHDEYIVSISANYTHNGLIVLAISTNQARQLRVGGTLGSEIQWNVPEGNQLSHLEGGLSTQGLLYLKLDSIPILSHIIP
jgi:Jacalin-like lectin domain